MVSFDTATNTPGGTAATPGTGYPSSGERPTVLGDVAYWIHSDNTKLERDVQFDVRRHEHAFLEWAGQTQFSDQAAFVFDPGVTPHWPRRFKVLPNSKHLKGERVFKRRLRRLLSDPRSPKGAPLMIRERLEVDHRFAGIASLSEQLCFPATRRTRYHHDAARFEPPTNRIGRQVR
jgi:hypothetical protein